MPASHCIGIETRSHDADVILEERLLEACDIRQEAAATKQELDRLRDEVALAAKERSAREAQLQVSRSCLRKMDRRLRALQGDARQSAEPRLVCSEVSQLRRRRELLLRERDSLERLASEHEKQACSLGGFISASDDQDPDANDEDASPLPAKMVSIASDSRSPARGRNMNPITALSSPRRPRADSSVTDFSVSDDLIFDLRQAREEELASREEVAAQEAELSCARREVRAEAVARSEVAVCIRDLQAALTTSRQRSMSNESANNIQTDRLEQQARALHQELSTLAQLRRSQVSEIPPSNRSCNLGMEVRQLEGRIDASESAVKRLQDALSGRLASARERRSRLASEEEHAATLVEAMRQMAATQESSCHHIQENRGEPNEADETAAGSVDPHKRQSQIKYDLHDWRESNTAFGELALSTVMAQVQKAKRAYAKEIRHACEEREMLQQVRAGKREPGRRGSSSLAST